MEIFDLQPRFPHKTTSYIIGVRVHFGGTVLLNAACTVCVGRKCHNGVGKDSSLVRCYAAFTSLFSWTAYSEVKGTANLRNVGGLLPVNIDLRALHVVKLKCRAFSPYVVYL
jgi:hypothetical protein